MVGNAVFEHVVDRWLNKPVTEGTIEQPGEVVVVVGAFGKMAGQSMQQSAQRAGDASVKIVGKIAVAEMVDFLDHRLN